MNYWKYYSPFRNLFSIGLWIWMLCGATGVYLFSKETLFFTFNQLHSYPGDLFFQYFTHVGDGLMMLALGIVLLGLGKRRLGILLLISFIFSGLLAQAIKRAKPEPRPGLHFAQVDVIHRVNDDLLKANNSFPSGHTTTAFAMFSLLSFSVRNPTVQLFYLLLALAVGFSRLYLGQHFFKDVWVGSLIGYGTSLFIFWIFREQDFSSFQWKRRKQQSTD
jgi:membrane-associated phospholipid phosphatase